MPRKDCSWGVSSIRPQRAGEPRGSLHTPIVLSGTVMSLFGILIATITLLHLLGWLALLVVITVCIPLMLRTMEDVKKRGSLGFVGSGAIYFGISLNFYLAAGCYLSLSSSGRICIESL